MANLLVQLHRLATLVQRAHSVRWTTQHRSLARRLLIRNELFDAPGLHGAQLFSSRHPKTVQRHFHWMAEHGVDGVFLQRFAGQYDTAPGGESEGGRGMIRIRDEVGELVRGVAEKENRVWVIMYDISGVSTDRCLHAVVGNGARFQMAETIQ
ncbi:hypothetical protein BDZ89DRAFT_1142730 [Hymenopellis radicata]|nr:hypothetical protein BDZ89DRAFT_1142730 [Hymenopellis radicata]